MFFGEELTKNVKGIAMSNFVRLLTLTRLDVKERQHSVWWQFIMVKYMCFSGLFLLKRFSDLLYRLYQSPFLCTGISFQKWYQILLSPNWSHLSRIQSRIYRKFKRISENCIKYLFLCRNCNVAGCISCEKLHCACISL